MDLIDLIRFNFLNYQHKKRIQMTYPTNILKRYQGLANPEETLNLNIRTIISSYSSPWDPLTELIQNAVDAINQRKAIENGAFKGEILITVDPLENILMIEDNGIGMDPGNAETLLLPSGTFKKLGNTYEHKGLGFTYCSHIVDYVEVDTEQFQSHAKDHWIFENGFNWVNAISKTTKLKRLTNSFIRQFTEHVGTCVKMKFAIGTYDRNIGNTASLDNFFNWASEPNILSFVLRTRTAIGQVHNLFGKQPPVDIIISVAFKHINKTITVPYSYFDFYNYAPFNQQTVSLASDYATNIYLNPVVPNKIHHGIYTVFQHDAQNPTTPLKVGSMRGGVQFSGYFYCCGKDNFSQALEQYDNRLGIDGEFNYLVISPEVHLAIDGMPNGVPIDNWNTKVHLNKDILP
ncbi:hypothetical protein COD84_08680 [Bacillus cereus]|nr:hypothetical protein COD84_08680 [Bacillus cereus]